ncbi:MAG: Prephenate dehydrogenase [uncultured bacterium (gcode 4)]|uniref:Prephenate dehydrogenase n=1 Tax=uncultured bacterium (gcode 4) TaxID=1234023 RepID=K2FEJ3_9BACT|nr:MAG: Prephenate dehydrogenase [uncultured bacterium (gcode 4)]
MKNHKIVIIWWTSKFWQFWQRYFEGKWHEVIVSSRNTLIKPEEAVKLWDIIIFSVSIRSTISVIRELVPLIPPNRLIMDFTWIKIEATDELRKYALWEVVATHPMFGPWIKSLKNQNIAFDSILWWEKWDYIRNLWKGDEANLIELESSRHDELVAIVQSSVHFINLLMGHILRKRDIHPDKLMAISTPNSRMQLLILSRFLNQEAKLYTDMQMCNTIYKNEIIPEIREYSDYLTKIITDKDDGKFEEEFNSVKDFIGAEFLDNALKVTSKIDEELKKAI